MVCVGILLSFHVVVPYTVPQYVISGFIMFVSAEVLEGIRLIQDLNIFTESVSFLEMFFFVRRCELIVTIESNVIEAVTWDVQWRFIVDGGWNDRTSDC